MKILSNEFLPVPTVSAHAGAITYFNGERILAWFGGSVEGACDCDIYIQRGTEEPRALGVNFSNYPAWNPVFVQVSKRLFLFFKVGKFCDSWQTFYMEYKNGSFDRQGMKSLPAGLNGPVKTPPVVGPKGIVFFGSSVETFFSWAAYIEVFEFRKGEFKFQERSNPIQLPEDARGGGLIQPSLIADKRGDIHAFFRSKFTNRIWHGTDRNNFRKLTEYSKGPNSACCAVYHKGLAYLAHNPLPEERLPLMVNCMDLEKDHILTREQLLVEATVDQEKYETINAVVMHPSGQRNRIIGVTEEASYPYMIVNPEGNLELVYTYGRRGIKRAVIGDLP